MIPVTAVTEPFADEPARFLEWAARSAAHDLSNQLLAIQWSSSLLDESRGEPAEVGELAREIDQAVGRARSTLSFLSMLVSPALEDAPGPLEVSVLLHHAAGLIRLAVGSDAGVELDLRRCRSCRLGVAARGFVRTLVRLATDCAERRPGSVLTLEATTSGDSAAAPAGWLRIAVRGEPEGGAAAAGPEPALADLAAYVRRRLGGELSWRGAGGWELRVAVLVEAATEADPGGAPPAVVRKA